MSKTQRGHIGAKTRRAIHLQKRIVCERCGVDLRQLHAEAFPKIGGIIQFDEVNAPLRDDVAMMTIRALADQWYLKQTARIMKRQEARAAHPWLKGLGSKTTLYELDHKVPLCEGGTDTVDNLRILCLGCHKEVTRDLASRRARRPKKGYQSFAR